MHCVRVRSRMHRHCRDAQLLAGPQDAKRDLAAIGYENLIEHVVSNARIANSERGVANREEAIRHPLLTIRLLLNNHERLAELDGLAVLDENLRHRAGTRRW